MHQHGDLDKTAMSHYPPPSPLPQIRIHKRRNPVAIPLLAMGLGLSAVVNIVLFWALATGETETTRSAGIEEEPSSVPAEPLEPSLPQTESGATALAASEVYEMASPSVVTVQCARNEGTAFSYALSPPSSEVSVLVTNHHVVVDCWEASTDVWLLTPTSEEYSARILAVDEANDLALLGTQALLEPLQSGNEARIGDPVFAIGSPLGTRGTITQGIVSNTDSRSYQIDAGIFPGNSGGPLLDRFGAVLGVNTEKAVSPDSAPAAEGIGFSYRIQLLCDTLVTCE